MPNYGGNKADPTFTFWEDSPDNDAPQAGGLIGAATANPNRH
jgi:hypothetical protein